MEKVYLKKIPEKQTKVNAVSIEQKFKDILFTKHL